MRFDLSDCSIVIPFSIDCDERVEHLEFLYSYLDRYFFNYQLIVVEHGAESKIPMPPNAQYKLLQTDEVFTLGKVTNSGAELVKTPFFCKFDVDVVIHPKALFDALHELKRKPEISMILPYNGVSFTIQNPLRKEILARCDFDKLRFTKKEDLPQWHEKHMYIKNGAATGLIHLFRTDVFRQLGGYNDEFMGWGYDDEEIVARFRQLKNPPKYLENYNAFHLDHPRIPGNAAYTARNHFLSYVIGAMDEGDLRAYIKTWNRFS